VFTSTVRGEIAFGLESLGLSRAEIQRRVMESAEVMGIARLLDRAPHSLSGGEQQLVAIAAAMALRPQVLVLDEPYANLDAVGVRRVRAALRAIHAQGTAIVLIEHRLQHAVADATRIVVLHQGRVVLDGPPRQVLAHDLTPFGLSPPLAVHLARAWGLSQVPLSVGELAALVRAHPGSSLALPPHLACPDRAQGPPTLAEPVIRSKHLSFARDGVPILCQVDLDVYQGECLAIVGANGAGKTSLIKHLNALFRPTSGRVDVLGRDTRKAKTSDLARRVGMAFQNPNAQFFKARVAEELRVGPQVLGRVDEEWMKELVRLFRLDPLLKRSPYRLSEGEKRRVTFAAALAARPQILVLDEPTAGQDARFRQVLGSVLRQLQSRGHTIVLATHDLEFAETCADRWAVMADGRVLSSGRPWEVMANTDLMDQAHLEPTEAFEVGRMWREMVPEVAC